MPFVFSCPWAGPHWVFSDLTRLSYYRNAYARAVVNLFAGLLHSSFALIMVFGWRVFPDRCKMGLSRKRLKKVFEKSDNAQCRLILCISRVIYVFFIIMNLVLPFN